MNTSTTAHHLLCRISPETEKMLNYQSGLESNSSIIYMAMASWADVQGFKNSAKFLYKHAEEERKHMLKIIHYINDMGGHALQAEITEIEHYFESLRQVFEKVYSHESFITSSIHNLVDHCLKVKDYTTFNFLQWYVEEQREEENFSKRALELFDIIGEDGVGLYMIDKEIGKLIYTNNDN